VTLERVQSSPDDTVGERKERGDEPEQHKSAAEMHLQISRAMEQIRLANVREAAAEAQAPKASAKETPAT
jgi:hypothetical protein